MRTKRTESGQIMPIVALLMVIIIGMAAFAVDGSNVYSQHRRMQADLDVAVKVAGAKMYVVSQSSGSYANSATIAITTAAQLLAQDGYPNNLATAPASSPLFTPSGAAGLCGDDSASSGIKICTPPSSGAFQDRADYVEGILKQNVQGFFGSVIGLKRLRISVRATAAVGGIAQPFSILALDYYPGDICALSVQDAAATLITRPGSIASDSQTCNNGTAQIDGTSQSSYASANPITGSVGTENGGAAYIPNPYTPSLPGGHPLTMNAITICAGGSNCPSGSYASFNDLPNSYFSETPKAQCLANLESTWPAFQNVPPSNVTYYLPPDPPGGLSPTGHPGKVVTASASTLASGTESDFLPHCDYGNPLWVTPGIYYFTGTGNTDIKTAGTATINSYNSVFVLDPAQAKLIEESGTSGPCTGSTASTCAKWQLNAPGSGPAPGSSPYQGIAIYEDTPCFPSSNSSLKLNGNSGSHINGIIDASCATVSLSGDTTDTSPFVTGAVVGWQVTVAGHGTGVVSYDPTATPLNRGSVLVE